MVWAAVRPAGFAGAVVALIGMTVGTVAEPPAAAPPVDAVPGFRIYAGDFHVHSFPGDGVLAPSVIAREARRHRLDAIGLTNHNSMLSWRLTSTPRPGDALLIPGQEVTSPGYHIAAIGLDHPVPWRLPAADIAAAVHGQGGVAIAAHPGADSWPGFDDRALDALDGVEVAHPSMFASRENADDLAQFYQRASRRHRGIAAIGSTDFHFWRPVGLCRTYLFATARTPEAMLEAIRSGRTVACDGAGRAYGPAKLVSLVRDLCAEDTAASKRFGTRTETWAAAAVLIGLTVLVLFR